VNIYHNAKKYVLIFLFGLYCLFALADLFTEAKTMIDSRELYGMDDSSQRTALFGETWTTVEKIGRIIPEDSKVLLTGDTNEMLYLTYFLHPRKLYRYSYSANRQIERNPVKVNSGWLKKIGIQWIVINDTDNSIRVMKIFNGRAEYVPGFSDALNRGGQ